ncbi:MAG: hypothetical protein QOG49_970, partial [Frankiaceae bacterium]|nr:hypothetical protein [Frankiaceae bacterium]
GHPDIARAGTSNIDALLFNPATGAFTTTVLSSDPENQGTSVADFNGDGYADIATVQQLADGSAYNEVFYLNDGSGAFTLSVNMYSAGFTYTQHVADFNNDGAPDVLLASDNDLNTVFANTTAPSAPAVLAQPVDRIVNNGSTTTFTATATGKPAPTVRWQQLSTASGAVFTDIAGATSGSYSVLAAPALDGYQYHAVFTNGSGAATTNAATLTLNDYAAIVGSQTGSGTVTAGDPANFSVVGYGKPAPTVQWRVSTDGGTTFGDIAGATSTTYSFTTTYADNGNRYLAVLTNTGGTASSTASTLTVSRRVPAVASQPVSAVVNPGDTASFTSSVSADPAATVQWQVSSDGVTFTNVADATTTTLTFTASASMTGNAYRAVFTNGFAESATSNAATLTVNLPPAVVSVTPAVVSAAPATAYGVPTIQLDATTIGYGERTGLTGSTRPNTLVNIYGYTRPDTTYDRLAQVRSDATGRFVFTTVFAANSRLYVIVPRLGRSRLVAENVRSTLTFKATKTAANRYVFTGRVRPVHAGQHVTIYYRTARGGKVILVRTDADVDGNYRVSRTVYAFGQRGYTVFAHVDSGVVLLGNNSRDLGISTYRAPR